MDLALNSDKSQYAALETIFKEVGFKDFSMNRSGGNWGFPVGTDEMCVWDPELWP